MSDMARENHGDLIASDRVEGTTVYNRQGERLGHISNFMVDKRSGQVRYAVLSFGGFLGMGTDHYPLPWSMLSYDTDRGRLCSGSRPRHIGPGAPASARRTAGLRRHLWPQRVPLLWAGLPLVRNIRAASRRAKGVAADAFG